MLSKVETKTDLEDLKTKIIEEIEKGNIVIDPFDKDKVNPNSYNLHLGNELYVYKNTTIDSKNNNEVEKIIIPETGLLLLPNTLYIGRTVEYTETHDCIPMLNGRSSIGRLGITIHVTAGFGDVGFKGTWTLEIFCIKPVIIYPNTEICQICYFPAIGDTDISYKGKYLGQVDATPSRLYTEYDK